METSKNNNAQDFFLYLVVFFSLTFLAFGAGSILFQAVNKFLPDQIANAFDQGGVRFGLAALTIASPIFLLLSSIIGKRLITGVTALESGVRKWLTYIVLFFAAATVIGDLITLIFNFLGGETTDGFLWKVLIVAAIAGGIFAFYFWDMRKTEIGEKEKKLNKISALSLAGFLLVVFAGAFFIIDSPTLAREKRIDNRLVSDAQSVDGAIRNFFTQAKKLPANLAELEKASLSPYLQAENKIEYVVTGEKTYNLCASFLRDNKNDRDSSDGSFGMQSANDWKHQAGKVCFERVALDENVGKTMAD
ncbi:MAG: DUF5671 domain-containing protein [Candidatus Moraniibacteriota bacterium]